MLKINFDKEKIKKYLPSKKFALIIVAIIVLLGIIYAIFFMASGGENFLTGKQKDNLPLKVENQTLLGLIQNDSDGDSVADWEEALWGTNKNKKMTFGNTPEATYIENKKKELKMEETSKVEEQNLTETEKFAREFFTSYAAMKSSGQVDSDTINNFSTALGQKIISPNLIDAYSEKDVKINTNPDSNTKLNYYTEIKSIFEKYKSEGIGDELSIVSTSLASGSTNASGEKAGNLSVIAGAYKDFAKEAMKINVPKDLVSYHLKIVNSANNTGISVGNMVKMISDPLVGLSGLSQYQKYSDDLVKAVGDLETVLQ
ncbi:MAG: hypothetical protein WCX46_04380 [Candidatus Paceibacterota bacterium]